MSRQGWVEATRILMADGPPLSNSTSITSLLNPQDKIVIPGGLITVGRSFRLCVLARMSTVVTTPGTWTMTVRYGTTSIGATQAFALTTTAQTNDTWQMDWNFVCRAEGSSGNFMHGGQATSAVFTNAVSTVMIPATAPAVGGNADLSVNGYIDLMGTWSVASASNSFTVHQFSLEWLN